MKRIEALLILPGALAIIAAAGEPSGAASEGQVSGGGQFTGLFGLEYVTVNADEKPDGSVLGPFEVHGTLSPGVDSVHGTVNCLYFIDDHTAVVSGIVTDVHNLPPARSFSPARPSPLQLTTTAWDSMGLRT